MGADERGREAFEGRRFDMRWQVRTAMIEAITRMAQRGVLSFDKARRQAAATLATSDGFRTHYTFKEAYNRLMAVGQSASPAPSAPRVTPLPPWTGETTEEVTEETTSHVERRRDSLLSALLLVLRPLLNDGGKTELEHTHSVDAFMDHLVGEITESGAGGREADPRSVSEEVADSVRAQDITGSGGITKERGGQYKAQECSTENALRTGAIMVSEARSFAERTFPSTSTNPAP